MIRGSHVFHLILRRMRTPLIVLIGAYAVSVLGFVLIPGMDNQGRPYRMDFFHAFYFVSFMGSTIGFGELPYPFTGAQRLWTLFTIYATVVSWLYAIGALIALVQTPTFRAALTRNVFIRQVQKIRQPFFIVCGYGDTGKIVAGALHEQGIGSVVIDLDADRIAELALEDLSREVPHLHADCSDSDTLERAGIRHAQCRGVVAVTRSDEVNLKVAIAGKLLNPQARVYCRAEHVETQANMESFGTDYIVNPYHVFAQHLFYALASPDRYLLHRWLSSFSDGAIASVALPRGRWLLCGYGRFGKAVYKKLLERGLPVTVIELEPEATQAPAGSIAGRGTEGDRIISRETLISPLKRRARFGQEDTLLLR